MGSPFAVTPIMQAFISLSPMKTRYPIDSDMASIIKFRMQHLQVKSAGAFAICLSVAHEYLDDNYLVFQAMAACGRRRQIDPVCRFPVTQRDDLEPIAGSGIAAINGGSVKSRRQHAA